MLNVQNMHQLKISHFLFQRRQTNQFDLKLKSVSAVLIAACWLYVCCLLDFYFCLLAFLFCPFGIHLYLYLYWPLGLIVLQAVFILTWYRARIFFPITSLLLHDGDRSCPPL
jgi:hypothetical protein